MKKPRISIAMATYNGARYLREQLESFVRQARQSDELVVTDDGSSDDTPAILESFRSSAPFEVKVYRNSVRLGYTKNFEKALSLCSGDVIFMSDQDDVWFPEKIERVTSHLSSNPQMMAITNDEILTDEKLTPHGEGALRSLKSAGAQDTAFFPGCCTAIRREWRDAALPIPAHDFTYDRWINTLADLLCLRVFLKEPLQYSRRHASNTSSLSLSPPRKAPSFGTVRALGLLQDSRPRWLIEKNRRAAFRRWVEEHEGLLCAFRLEGTGKRVSKRLEAEIRALERRIQLTALPRGLRAPAVVRFLMEGGYTQFSGWRSAVNDLLRRADEGRKASATGTCIE